MQLERTKRYKSGQGGRLCASLCLCVLWKKEAEILRKERKKEHIKERTKEKERRENSRG